MALAFSHPAAIDAGVGFLPSVAQLVNASISGDTTSGGLARLPALLKQHKPTLLVIELGGKES